MLGAALAGKCAPAGDNHEQFYAASPSPAWHVVATEYGHADMIDEDAARKAAFLCRGNDVRDPMRRLTAGLLVAFFRASLQNDPSAFDLINASEAPTAVTVEAK